MAGRQFAGAGGGDGQDQILGGGHFGVAVGGKLAEFSGWLGGAGVGGASLDGFGFGFGVVGFGFFGGTCNQAALFEVGFACRRVRLEMADHRHRDDPVACGQTDAPNPGRAARFEDADLGGGEPDRAAKGGHQHHVVLVIADGGVDQSDALGQFHRDFAVAQDVGEITEVVLPHIAVRGGKDDLQIVPLRLRRIDRHQGGDRNAGNDGQDIDDGLALGGPAGQRQTPGFQLVDHAIGGEKQQVGVGVGDEKCRHDVVILGLHRSQTLAAPVLGAEFGQRRALDIAAGGDGHDHILAFNEVFILHITGPVDDLSTAGHREQGFHLAEFVGNDRHDPLATAQDDQVILDLECEVFQFVGDFLDAQSGQALQAQVQDRAGLHLAEIIAAIGVHRVAGVVDQPDERGNLTGGPAAGHQLFAGFGGVSTGADGAHDLVDVGNRNRQTAQDMAAFAGFLQFKRGAAGDNFLAEGDEMAEKIAQGEGFGAATVQRQHVAGERGLHRRETEQLV